MLYRDALLASMTRMLETNPHSMILGQGVADHKGTFGTTKGLVETFGSERVIDTPLSEEAVTGIAVGLALTGYYPVMTHIRLDFALLSMNQIVNMAAKYRYMFGGVHQVPLLIRLVVGRSWGQGAQHSQSLQSLFAHIPGLTVLMPSNSRDVLDFYAYAAESWPNPVISLEHRLLYDLDFDLGPSAAPANSVPWSPQVVRNGRDVTVVADSIMTLEARRAAEFLESHHGISAEVIDLGCVSTIDPGVILDSLSRTRRLVIADTSWAPFGVAAEISRLVVEADPGLLQAPVRSVTTAFTPCPTAKALEDDFYPDQATMCREVLRVCELDQADEGALPERESFRDYYNHFRGPF